LITWISLGIAAVVLIGLAWILLRFRERPGAGLPRQVRGHALLEIGWTVVPGRQWWWEFYYPAYQLTTANELHLPVGRTATLTLEGPDVIHSFWVPQL